MYLYIFEDGTVCQSRYAPAKDDLVCIGDGVLQVICLGDGLRYYEVQPDGSLVLVPSATLVNDTHHEARSGDI